MFGGSDEVEASEVELSMAGLVSAPPPLARRPEREALDLQFCWPLAASPLSAPLIWQRPAGDRRARQQAGSRCMLDPLAGQPCSRYRPACRNGRARTN